MYPRQVYAKILDILVLEYFPKFFLVLIVKGASILPSVCILAKQFLKNLKKYLLKSIDAENKDSKAARALKTLALGWLFNKRAFSVSGKFRKMLIDLIKT
jgi:hypothetical protein